MSLDYRYFMRELDKTKKLLSETYMLNNDEPMDGPMPEYQDDDLDYPDEEYEEEEGRDMGNKDMENQDISRYDERIAKIREVAIQGLQDYAENVNDARYQFFKKVFLECDKACQEKDGGNVK